MKLRRTYAERVRSLMDRANWGEDALPALTLRQGRLLMDAMHDLYCVGVLHGEKLMRRKAHAASESCTNGECPVKMLRVLDEVIDRTRQEAHMPRPDGEE